MKKLITLIVLLVSLNTMAQHKDHIGWLFVKEKNIPLDTQAHIAGGLAFGGPATLFWKDTTKSRTGGLVLGNLTIFGAAVLKEGLDVKNNGKFSWNDVAWTCAGGLVSSFTLDLWSENTKKARQLETIKEMQRQ